MNDWLTCYDAVCYVSILVHITSSIFVCYLSSIDLFKVVSEYLFGFEYVYVIVGHDLVPFDLYGWRV